MAFVNGLDVTPFVGTESSPSSYVSGGNSVLTDGGEISLPILEYSPSSYVVSSSKVMRQGMEITWSSPLEASESGYAIPDLLKTFNSGAPIDYAALPKNPGDDTIELKFAAYCQFSYSVIDTSPFTVQFTDESVGDIVMWSWDFDDGSPISNIQNPNHIFDPGIYDVTLTVEFSSGAMASSEETLVVPEGDVNLYLVKNGADGSSIANSIVLIDEDEIATFFTTDNSPTADPVDNLMTYNYGSDDFDIGNPPANVTDSMPNTDPELTDVSGFDWDTDSVSEIMEKTFLPENTSMAIDNGNNDFVSDIETDIIGNPRIYISGLVDIGPYELQLHQIKFLSDDIQSIFQDKLQFDYPNKRYTLAVGDDIYADLYSQFNDNPSFRAEYARDSKVIIKLKRVFKNVIFYSDKENIFLGEFEAYYDSGAKSIIVTKTDETLGNLFSGVFDDGRYIFDFDEVTHKLKIFINPTYNKGKSGKGNIVNSVRIGGTSIVNE